ncbi:MAG: prolyl oligopeptidase family serine peptidase [Actinomycetota bacterium]
MARPVVRSYPTARTVDQSDVYHGAFSVPDPYRWMEDVEDPELGPWLEAQSALSRDVLGAIPCRERFGSRLTELWRLPTVGIPLERAGRWFQHRNPGNLDQSPLFVFDRPDDQGRLLLDPNELGGKVIVSDTHPSPDGSKLLWAETEGGSDWKVWRVLEVDSGRRLDDEAGESKLWACWLPDGSGFLYLRFPSQGGKGTTRATGIPQLVLHRLGTDSSSDELVFEDRDNPRYFFPSVSDDGRYLVLTFLLGPGAEIIYSPIDERNFSTLATTDNQFFFLGSRGDTFFVTTTHEAPYGRVVAVDLKDPDPQSWRDVVPESSDRPLPIFVRSGLAGDWVLAARDYLGSSSVGLYRLDGSDSYEIDWPGTFQFVPGDVAEPVGASSDGREVFFAITSPTSPGTILRHDLETRSTEVVWEPEGAPSNLQVAAEQVWASSPDGTKVPMTILRNSSSSRESPPVVIEGYGGGGSNQQPYSFNPWKVAWLEAGGVIATGHLRGGAELGVEWQKAAERGGKLKAMEDFIGCAEFFVSNEITSVERIGITGNSSGGMLAAAAAVRRPDLFGACVPQVGMFDPLRYHLFGLGSLMIAEYGTSDDPEDFKAMYAYSPLHNIIGGTEYPAFLITVHEDDDRVLPGSGYKFAATLQEAQAADSPILLRLRAGAGHFGGGISSGIDETADILAFLGITLGVSGCGGD